MMTTPTSPRTFRARVRPWSLATLLWAFGLFTSILLIGLWGRSVVADHHTLEDATRAVLASGLVNDRVEDWVTEGIVAAQDQAPGEVATAVDAAFRSPRVQGSLDDVVDRAVAAALAPPESGAALDLSTALEETLPALGEALADQGLTSQEEALRRATEEIPDLVLTSGDRGVVWNAAHRAGGLLTKVVVVGLTGLLLTGGGAVALSEERHRQLRSLMVKIAISAFTFAIFLRVGAWAVDPRGGRSPIAAGTSQVLGSNLHIPAIVGLVATVLVLVSLLLRRRRRGDGTVGEPPDDSEPDQSTVEGAAQDTAAR